MSRNSVASFIRINVRFALVRTAELLKEKKRKGQGAEGEEGGGEGRGCERTINSIKPRSKRECQQCLFPNVERALLTYNKVPCFSFSYYIKLKISRTPEKKLLLQIMYSLNTIQYVLLKFGSWTRGYCIFHVAKMPLCISVSCAMPCHCFVSGVRVSIISSDNSSSCPLRSQYTSYKFYSPITNSDTLH